MKYIEREVPGVERKHYLVSIPMTEAEAETLMRTAAARGETIGTFLSGVITDIHNGLGDEGDMIEAYLDRSDPPGAEDSFTAFCLKSGYDVDTLEYCHKQEEDCRDTIEEYRAAIETGNFSPEDGWEPGTTAEDVREEIAFYEERLKDALEEKQEVWKWYKGQMTEEEAREEAKTYLEDLEAFQRDRITKEALKAIAERVTRYDPDNSND